MIGEPRRSMIALLTIVIALLAGCGGQSRRSTSTPSSGAQPGSSAPSPTTSTTTNSPAPHGRLLVYFKRVSGVDPLADYLTVYKGGQAAAVEVEGGVNGAKVRKFEMSRSELRRLQRLVEHARLRNSGCCNVAGYIYWVITPRRSSRLQQGTVPRASRPLISDLNAITSAHINY